MFSLALRGVMMDTTPPANPFSLGTHPGSVTLLVSGSWSDATIRVAATIGLRIEPP